MTTAAAPTTEAVQAAATAIIEAFAATGTEAYFAGFAPDATFVFHSEDHRLESRAEYEALWASWLESGWRVTSCASTNVRIQVFPGGAVFSHDVATSVVTPDGPESYRERETIVFRVADAVDAADADPASADGRSSLLAVHEHLSPVGA